VNDALAVYFIDVTIASAFVARRCAAQRVEIVEGVYRVRDDEPTTRIGADQGDFAEARSESSRCSRFRPRRPAPSRVMARKRR
jgi:hypothetical protein